MHASGWRAMRDSVMRFGVNVLSFRRDGDGDDFAPALQRAFDAGAAMLYLPEGVYPVGRPLRIRSGTTLALADRAHIAARAGTMTKRGDFLLTNANIDGGDADITLLGGVWDGNFPGNPKSAMYDAAGYSGTLLNFVNVRSLCLRGLTLHNSSAYFLRLARLRGFEVEDIRLSHDKNIANNDGVHLGGFCENGVIRNIRGVTPGTPSDDLVALNADDCITRTENLDLPRGFIRNVLVEDVYAEMCHCFVRLLSVTADISDVAVRNLQGGCLNNAVNLDAGRYCRAPLVKQGDPAYFHGAGDIRNVRMENIHVERAGKNTLVNPETDAERFAMWNFTREPGAGEGATLLLRNTAPARIRLLGITRAQLERLLAVSTLHRHTVTRHGADLFAMEITTDYHDTLALPEGGFAHFSMDRI